MRESIASVFVINFIIVFIGIFIGLLATSSSYSKAAKVKNTVMDIVERYADELNESDTIPDDIEAEIETNLAKLGYRLNVNKKNKCPEINNGKLMNDYSNYRYCVYKHEKVEVDDKGNPTSNKNGVSSGNLPRRGNYYTVITYMYFDIPLIGQHFELSVKGQTRTYFSEVKYNG